MSLLPARTRLHSSSPWLPGLVLTTFVIGTDDFIIAGVLPRIAADLSVSQAMAGQLVTVFSLVYAVGAPVLAVLTARFARKRLLVGGLAVFTLVNLVTMFATSYAALVALRIAAALVAAAVSPVAFAVAGTLAPAGRQGRAIGAVAAGLTISLVVGVPIGSWLGGVFDWQATFGFVALLTALAVAITALTLPTLPAAEQLGVRARLALLRAPAVLTCVVGTIIGACGGLMPYTFIAPVVDDLTGVGQAWLPVLIAGYGIAGAVGTVLGGRLNDSWGTDRAVWVLTVVVLSSVCAMALASIFLPGRVPLWLLGGLIAVWGMAGWAFNPPMNARALALAGQAGTEAIAVNTSGLYVGIAAAGALGGGALTSGGGTGVLLAATAVGLVNTAFMIFAVRRFPVRRAEGAVASDATG